MNISDRTHISDRAVLLVSAAVTFLAGGALIATGTVCIYDGWHTDNLSVWLVGVLACGKGFELLRALVCPPISAPSQIAATDCGCGVDHVQVTKSENLSGLQS